jgi:hypothetical protein
MSRKLPSKAEFWGVREPELRILLTVTHWFNGKSLMIRDEKRRIATHHDLPLKDLFRGTGWDYDPHQDAHERLLNNDLLQEEYVCRRKIEWGADSAGAEGYSRMLRTLRRKIAS